jgi:acetyltransferase
MAAGAGPLSARQARATVAGLRSGVGEYPLAGSIDEAIACADAIGYPVDLALLLANGVEFSESASGLRSPAEIRIAARDLRRRARTQQSGSRVKAYRLRPSAARSGAPALRLGVADDPVFGPVIFLGPASVTGFRGGRLVVALPPLNLVLASDLVTRSGFAEELPEDDRPALQAAVSNALVRLSQLLTDLDEVTGVDLDPLHAEASGVVVLGARIGVEQTAGRRGHRRFAIAPIRRNLNSKWIGRVAGS